MKKDLREKIWKKKINKRGKCMNKIIELLNRIFRKKPLLLEKGKTTVQEEILEKKENFLKSIKVDDDLSSLLAIQHKLENEGVEEENLNHQQITELKELYSRQIVNLINSINQYKLRLNGTK